MILRTFKTMALVFLLPLLCAFPAFAATTIPFTVNLSKAVIVTGTPRIAIDVGGVTRYATYSAGSGTPSLTFTYTMVAGDVDLDGVTIIQDVPTSTYLIDLNGGTIKDLSGNNLSPLTFTPPNTSNVKVNYPSLGMDFIYDSDGRYTLNGTIYNDLTSFLSAASGTFTRASIGTYYDSTGVLQTAASGAPRFDYDPATHAAKGILIEESRTNLLTNSGSPSTWAAGIYHATVGSTAYNAPNGAASAQEIISTATDASIPSNAVTGSFTTYTVSIYAKKGIGNGFRIEAVASIDSAFSGAYAKFDFSTNTASLDGAYTGKITGISASMQDVGNGWFRCIFTYSITGTSFTGALYQRFHPLLSTGVAGDSVTLWGYQLEQATFSTSYIPTTTAAVTRAADTLLINNIGLWSNTSKSTLFSIFTSFGTTVNRQIASFGDGSSPYYNGAQRIGLSSSNTLEARQQTTSGESLTGNYTGPSANIIKKISFASDIAGTGSVAIDGTIQSLSQTGTAGTISFSKLGVGNDDMGTTQLNGYVQKFKYYPSILSNTQLQLLTQ